MSAESHLKGGVALVDLARRPELNGMTGDIVSYDEKTQRYGVKVRGCPTDHPLSKGVSVLKKNLIILLNKNEFADIEEEREALLQKAAKKDDAKYMKRYVDALKLSDEINFYLFLHRKRLPKDIARLLHVKMIQEWVLSQSLTSPHATNSQSWPLSLTPFFRHDGMGIRQTSSSEVFKMIESSIRVAASGQKPFDASFLFKGVCFCLSRLGEMDAALTVPVNVSWSIHSLLFNDLNQLVSAAVDEEFKWAGAAGFSYKDLHWCIVLLHIQLQKDMRVGNPNNPEPHTTTQKEKIIECAKSAIQCRPELPRGYYIITQVYQDLLHVGDQADQFQAFQYAKQGIEVAELDGDPYYLYGMHLVVAYWMISDANKEPYSIREIKDHVAKADFYKMECKNYTPDVDFHRGEQHKMHIRSALKHAQKKWGLTDSQTLSQPLTCKPSDGCKDRGMSAKEKTFADQFHCANCRRVIMQMRACGRCGKVSYCNEECQKQHWRNGHKQECIPKKKRSDGK